jgi:predicted enzyme related to lactoylglutathione lyase
MCDDIDRTVAEFTHKGAVLGPIQERPWGRVTQIKLPSGAELGIYEPRHATAIGSPK